jgi:DNA-directed RNA polymerase subunit RPC12/RpoP
MKLKCPGCGRQFDRELLECEQGDKIWRCSGCSAPLVSDWGRPLHLNVWETYKEPDLEGRA